MLEYQLTTDWFEKVAKKKWDVLLPQLAIDFLRTCMRVNYEY
jgi:hypothetical protein